MLLVEDADALRKLTGMLLVEHGYLVLAAANGTEALVIAKKEIEPIDLLLTDVIMPGMSGRALAEMLGATQPGLTVLYMSGYTDDEIVRHGIVGAGIHLLHKPFSEDELIAKVREVLDVAQAAGPASRKSLILAGADSSVIGRDV